MKFVYLGMWREFIIYVWILIVGMCVLVLIMNNIKMNIEIILIMRFWVLVIL